MSETLLWTVDQTAAALSMSRSKLYEGISSGIIGPAGVKIGGKRYFDPIEVRSWIRAGCPARRVWLSKKEALR
jgi:predicted DNA-binding transcriptional regulator AlpA